MITIQHNQRHKQKERKTNKQTKYKQNTDSIKTICK